MEFVDHIRSMSREQAARAMVETLGHVSPETFMKLALLGSKLVEGEMATSAVEAVIDDLRTGEQGQASRMFRRVMTDLSPHCLKQVAKSLFINGLMQSSRLRSEFGRKHGFEPPFTLLISPTMMCNLKCLGCYAGKYKTKKGLPSELIDRILNEAKRMGIHFVVFSGGEPLMRKDDLLPLLGKHRDIYFMFYTNGTLIDDETADRLYELGNAGAVISLEGFEDATDYRRGQGVYRKVMDAMERLKKRGAPFGTSLTVTRHNVEELTDDRFVAHLVESGVMIIWYFLFMPVGKDPDTSLMPTPEQREYLRQRGRDLRDNHTVFIADFWNDAPFVGGCIAGGRNYVHINANGDVEPCVFTHVAVDNIYDKSLEDALNNRLFKAIRSRQPYSGNHLTPCMIIDHPHIFRQVCAECGAYPTHDGAEDVRVKIDKELDDYGRRVRELFGPIWAHERFDYGYGEVTSDVAAGAR